MQCIRTRPLISSTRSIKLLALPMADRISSSGESYISGREKGREKGRDKGKYTVVERKR